MKCPHCKVDFHDDPSEILWGEDIDGGWKFRSRKCPSCDRFIFHLINGEVIRTNTPGVQFANLRGPASGDVANIVEKQAILVRPNANSRPPCPPEVPKEIAEDYTEACLVLSASPKASAALSRRCLQHLLRDAANVKPGDLAKEIEQVIDGRTLPSYIGEAIDAVRHIGNFAAHPLKSKASGEVVPVEPEEAEWNLDVLEALFDFYYVQPAVLQKKKDALNRKLQEAGKNPMR